VWKGLSTLILASHTSGRVWAVDHWQGTPDDAVQHALYHEAGTSDVFREFADNTREYIEAGKVVPVAMDSASAALHLLAEHGRTFDFVFIDADHSYEGCAADIAAYLPLLAPGGLLAGHDYKPRWSGVIQAVDEAFGDAVSIGPASIWSINV
jgi:predicted O-methyltransferase YrrM